MTSSADGARPAGGSSGGSRPAVVLVGPPGAGKSTVGALLAERLGVPFIDTDEVLAGRAGSTVGELFLDLGEEDFRKAESEAVVDALAGGGVVALGSGALAAAAEALDRYRADGGQVVFLDVSLAAGVPRVGLNVPRAVVIGSPRAQFASMLEQRRPAYVAAATAVVDTSDRSPTEVADEVQALIR